MNDHFS